MDGNHEKISPSTTEERAKERLETDPIEGLPFGEGVSIRREWRFLDRRRRLEKNLRISQERRKRNTRAIAMLQLENSSNKPAIAIGRKERERMQGRERKPQGVVIPR